MTNDISGNVILLCLFLIGAGFTYWGCRENGAPRWAAFFIAALYPLVLPVVMVQFAYDQRGRY